MIFLNEPFWYDALNILQEPSMVDKYVVIENNENYAKRAASFPITLMYQRHVTHGLQYMLQRMSLPKCSTEHQRIRVSREKILERVYVAAKLYVCLRVVSFYMQARTLT